MVRRALEIIEVGNGIESLILNLASWPEHGLDEFILAYLGKCIESYLFLCLRVYVHNYV